jgi:hypothetical protein
MEINLMFSFLKPKSPEEIIAKQHKAEQKKTVKTYLKDLEKNPDSQGFRICDFRNSEDKKWHAWVIRDFLAVNIENVDRDKNFAKYFNGLDINKVIIEETYTEMNFPIVRVRAKVEDIAPWIPAAGKFTPADPARNTMAFSK